MYPSNSFFLRGIRVNSWRPSARHDQTVKSPSFFERTTDWWSERYCGTLVMREGWLGKFDRASTQGARPKLHRIQLKVASSYFLTILLILNRQFMTYFQDIRLLGSGKMWTATGLLGRLLSKKCEFSTILHIKIKNVKQ